MKRISLILIILLLISLLLTGCNSTDNSMGFIYGTTYELKLTGGNVKKAKEEIIAMLNDIEAKLSTSIMTSDVYLINNSIVNTPVNVSQLTIDMFVRSHSIYIDTNSAFNPTIYPIVRLWGFTPEQDITADREPPSNQSINELLTVVNFNSFLVDINELTVIRLNDKAMIDFGAIAKGYALQEALDICSNYNVAQALINIGGSVGSIGDTIKVGVQNPRESNNICFASFDMSDGYSVATSGDYERYFIHNEVRYHHIMDTTTGRPVDNGIIGVTIVTSDAELSDALSTSVFCLGAKDGMAFAMENNAKCLIIMNNNTYYVSPDFEITIIEEGYTEADINEAN